VEEQFYLFFPLLLWLSWRLGKTGVGIAASGRPGRVALALAQWGVIKELRQHSSCYPHARGS